LANFENGTRSVTERTQIDLQQALERAGIVFIDGDGGGPGVRLRNSDGAS
jgi:hypothetical protein